MPNWCYNRVSIRASSKVLNEIEKFVAGKQYHLPTECLFTKNKDVDLVESDCKFSFHSIIPQPDELLMQRDPRRRSSVPYTGDRTDNDVMPDWYNWRNSNWGTKWEVSDVSMLKGASSLVYEFETAWAPPEPVIARLSHLFPTARITLSFYEPGCIGRGSVIYKDGEVVKTTGAYA